MAGIRVWVSTPSGDVASRTDATGRFRLRGLDLTRSYPLRADLAPGETLPATSIGFGSQETCGELRLVVGAAGGPLLPIRMR